MIFILTYYITNIHDSETALMCNWFDLSAEPNNPTVSGQTTVILGSTNQWTCISRGGNPAPSVTWRIENISFSRGVTQTIVAQSDNTYIVTSNLVWTPTLFNDGQTLHCDVQHSQTRGSNLQTASLLLTVHGKTAYVNIDEGDALWLFMRQPYKSCELQTSTGSHKAFNYRHMFPPMACCLRAKNRIW